MTDIERFEAGDHYAQAKKRAPTHPHPQAHNGFGARLATAPWSLLLVGCGMRCTQAAHDRTGLHLRSLATPGLPGLRPFDLTIKAERPVPPRSDGIESVIAERPYGTFTRQVFPGTNLDTENVRAGYEAGVLTVVIPAAEQAEPRRIEVRTQSDKQELSGVAHNCNKRKGKDRPNWSVLLFPRAGQHGRPHSRYRQVDHHSGRPTADSAAGAFLRVDAALIAPSRRSCGVLGGGIIRARVLATGFLAVPVGHVFTPTRGAFSDPCRSHDGL
jgi:hypothetical protein